MIVQRLVFQAKYGQANEMVALLKRANDIFQKSGYAPGRIYTDISGEMFNIAWETEFTDLATWDQARSAIFSAPEFGSWFTEMQALVESGHREFWNLE